MATEEQARVRINAMLADAGYDLAGAANAAGGSVGYERAIRDSGMQGRVAGEGGKIPDYHLYPPQSNIPVALIEAKRAGSSLDKALRQALASAQVATGSKQPRLVLFASDGIQVRCMHGSGAPCRINGAVVDHFPAVGDLLALLETPELEVGAQLTAASDVIRLFEAAAGVMRADGIDPGIDQLREFSRFLFIKIMSERGNQEASQHWLSLQQTTGQNLMRAYRQVLAGYADRYGEIFQGSAINKPVTIEALVAAVSPVNFTSSGLDVKGEAFEFFLSSYSAGKKSVLGQFFTPRHITVMLAQILDPQPGEKIVDPFCGTGGMLIACYGHIRSQLDPARPGFAARERELKEHTLYGSDISAGASSLAKMNMILLGDGHTNITQRDSLEQLGGQRYDKLITNMPFNIKGQVSTELADRYYRLSGIAQPDWNEICIIKSIEAVKPGGSLAMIVPLTICHAGQYRAIRDYIAAKANIRCLLRLPAKTFIRYTAAQTAVLVLDHMHQQSTSELVLVPIVADGMSPNKWREPIRHNDIPAVVEHLTSDALRLADHPAATVINYASAEDFLGFASADSQTSSWALGDLLRVKTESCEIEPDKLYAEPGLSSSDNSVSVRGAPRLGRNLKGHGKVLAQTGDLIVGTLHTNNDNGLFAIADRDYLCTSQLVAEVKTDLVPLHYLLAFLRVEFPRQLIPTDLVGRETFKPEQILNVMIPQPGPATLKLARSLDQDIQQLQQAAADKLAQMRALVHGPPAPGETQPAELPTPTRKTQPVELPQPTSGGWQAALLATSSKTQPARTGTGSRAGTIITARAKADIVADFPTRGKHKRKLRLLIQLADKPRGKLSSLSS